MGYIPKKLFQNLVSEAGGLLPLGRVGTHLQRPSGGPGRWPSVTNREQSVDLHVHANVSGKRAKKQAFGETAGGRKGEKAEL